MDQNAYYEESLHPTPEFGPANYWFWQRIPAREEIDRQLDEMVEAGYRVFYIQPRLAFPIEKYMGAEYLAAYRYAIERAHSLGLKAGIYDDYNWNSGHAGGLTVKGHDEFRDRQLFWTSRSIDTSSFTLDISGIRTLMGDSLGGPQGQWTFEGGKALWANWQVIRVVGYPANLDLRSKTDYIDLSKFCTMKRSEGGGCQLEVNLPSNEYGGWRISAFISGVCITSRHMNYLNRQATTQFIKVGYEPYKKAVGDYFGSTIFCMFMDHPHAGFYAWDQLEGNIQNTLMFDESLVEAFEKEHDYPIEMAWLSFLLPATELTPKCRGDFFDTYGQLARENFLGQVSRWAHANGLQFGGHELFGFLGIWGFYGGYHVVDQRTDFGADYFGIGRYKDLSTVDAFNSNPQIDAKIGDSVARASGSHGCMLEQYYFSTDPNVPGAIGHWNLTLDEMRSQALRHTFFGTKQFIFHGFYLSDQVGTYELLASSRFDFAPGINYEPWFAQHGSFAREISRLSSFIYNAEPLNEIGLLYPLSTFWVEGTDGVFGDHSGIWNKWLLENGYGFDVIDESQLTFDPDHPGSIRTGTHSYKVLILPGVTVLRNLKQLADIAAFVKSGGTLLISGALPDSTVENGASSAVRAAFEGMLRSSRTVRYFESEQQITDALADLMSNILPQAPRVVSPVDPGKQIWSWTGKDEDDYLVALFNDSDSQQRVTVQIPQKGARPERWNLLTGQRSAWLWYQEDARSTRVLFDIMPREVACFRMDCSGQPPHPFHLVETPLRVIQAPGHLLRLSASMEVNQPGRYCVKVVGLAKMSSQMAMRSDSPVSFSPSAEELVIEVLGMPAKVTLNGPWKLTIPGKAHESVVDLASGWETQGFEDYAGEGSYETTFDMLGATDNWMPWNWKLVFPQVFTSAEVVLNGRTVGIIPWPPYELNLPAGILKPHDNHLRVKVYNSAGNFYYSGGPYSVAKAPSGIVGHPVLEPFKQVRVSAEGIEDY